MDMRKPTDADKEWFYSRDPDWLFDRPVDDGDDATARLLARLLAENKRMRDALCALDGVQVVDTSENPGIGHEAMWRIVQEGLSGL